MSYINEALKKAQKDKDAVRMDYMHSIGKSGILKRSFDIKYIFLIIIILLLGVLIYTVFGGHRQDVKKSSETPETIPVAEKQNSGNVQVKNKKNVIKKSITEQDNNKLKKVSQREELYKQAVSFFEAKKIEEARDIYNKILEQDPGHINSLNDMGVLLLHEGKYNEAISYLEKAVRLKPTFVNPIYNLACAYSLQNKGEKGMVYLLKAVQIDYRVKEWAKEDPDLQNLREYAEFTLLIDKK